MPERINRVPLIGVFLIACGALLLVSKLHWIGFGWGRVVWGTVGAFGFVAAIQGFVQKRRGKVFWGSIFFFVSIYFSLVLWRVLPEQPEAWFPHLCLAMGLAFLMLFLLEPRNVPILVPTVLFLGIGVIYYLWSWEIVEMYDVKRAVRTYWPMILVLWGLTLVFRRRR